MKKKETTCQNTLSFLLVLVLTISCFLLPDTAMAAAYKAAPANVDTVPQVSSKLVGIRSSRKTGARIKLNKSSLKLRKKGTYQLRATVTGKKGRVRWTSSNPKVVSVSGSGKVKALKAGTARITASISGLKASCKVTVNKTRNTVEIRTYLQKGISPRGEYIDDLKKLSKKIGGMKTIRHSKYSSYYSTGNHMSIGANANAAYGTYSDEYTYIANTGNKNVLFYGARIGDTRAEMEKKFKPYNIRTYNGTSYFSGNSWALNVQFSGGRLKSYTYICAPTG